MFVLPLDNYVIFCYNNNVNIFLTLLLTVNIALLCFVIYGFVVLRNVFKQGKAFITPESEGKASPLANVTQVAADMIGRGVSAQLKATFMGKARVDQKNEQSIAGDIAVDSLSMANPLIGAVLQSFPTLTKRLQKNPALLDIALQKIASGVKSPVDNHSPGNGHPGNFDL